MVSLFKLSSRDTGSSSSTPLFVEKKQRGTNRLGRYIYILYIYILILYTRTLHLPAGRYPRLLRGNARVYNTPSAATRLVPCGLLQDNVNARVRRGLVSPPHSRCNLFKTREKSVISQKAADASLKSAGMVL